MRIRSDVNLLQFFGQFERDLLWLMLSIPGIKSRRKLSVSELQRIPFNYLSEREVKGSEKSYSR